MFVLIIDRSIMLQANRFLSKVAVASLMKFMVKTKEDFQGTKAISDSVTFYARIIKEDIGT